MLDRFEAMYHNALSIAALQAEIDECQEDAEIAQRLRDESECSWLHLRDDSRIDPVQYAERSCEILEKLKHDIETHTTNFDALQTTMAELRADKEGLWTDLRNDASHYFNSCLAADFKTNWSLDEEDCRALRTIIDQNYLITHTRRELAELNSRHCAIGHERRTANQQANVKAARLGGDLSRALDQARKERIQVELDRIALEIRKKQDLLRLRQDRYREDQESFCEDNLQALLRRSGRIEPEVPEPEVPEPDVDLSDMPSDTNPNPPVDWLPTAETEFQSSDDRQRDPDIANEASSDKYGAAERSLEREYIQVQDRLTQLQQEYGAKKY
ncbi:hypothetical protein M409DRAFT_19495 [Zasmidium cellare ATCC 36951]|uniref:Uncharacterized protein n=1 Tax=Zasmidium cellare ATCC 36951 TaxID=1080233 RepID=A0A6A6CXZ3_ZASCE|nr:uncharacterized protein M409DRAFT_19495 [Zasmidium cellare ATCC 36951]KAF2170679.1 hypothetical protein M409DRAFT_19495 [Zasmidium cellare ATCC 36951]